MSYTNFKPTIWAEAIDRELQKNLVYGMLANRNYEELILEHGKTIKIPSITSVTVGDYTGADIAFSEDDGAEQTITIDKAKYFGIAIDDVDKAQAQNGIMDIRLRNAVYKMSDEIDKDLANLYVKAKNKVAGTIGVDRISTKIIDLAVEMDKANVPSAGRWLVLSPEVAGELIKELPNISTGEQVLEVHKQFYIGQFGGFEIYKSNNVPLKTKKYHCIAGVSAGLTLAMQVSKVEAGRFEKSFKEFVKGLNVYGCDVLETETGKTTLITELEITQATTGVGA